MGAALKKLEKEETTEIEISADLKRLENEKEEVFTKSEAKIIQERELVIQKKILEDRLVKTVKKIIIATELLKNAKEEEKEIKEDLAFLLHKMKAEEGMPLLQEMSSNNFSE